MAKDALVQVRIDSELKKQVEELYESLGTSFSEVIRMMAIQSLETNGIPFEVSKPVHKERKLVARGIAHKYADPSKIPFEKNAWKEAVLKKYADN